MRKIKLDSFPAELQLEVFRHLDNTDLKAVRAVSRKLRDNASPSLFRSVVACARYEALGALQSIAGHPVLRKYVHEIVFDGSIYCTWLASSSDQYKMQNNKYDQLRTGSYYFIRERWIRYRELYEEQEDLKASGVLLQTIAKALKSTTNVSRVVYSPFSRLVPVERKTVRDLVPRDYRADIGARSRYPIRPHVSPENHPFRELIGAVYVAQYTGIRELRVEPFDENDQGAPFTLDLLDCPDPETDLKAGQFLFRHLEKCELNIRARFTHNNMPGLTLGTQGVVHLESLIGAARDLRDLALHVSDGGPGDSRWHNGNAQVEQLGFHRLGLNTTWPRLRSLSVEGITANESEFLDLIARHTHTLRMVSLRNCSLFTGLWANIVNEALSHTRLLPFVLSSVNELQIPLDPSTLVSSAHMYEWRYEGCIEVAEDGERTFVDLVPTKKSVYSRVL